MQGSAYSEAVALLGSALELVKALPDDRVRDRIEISLCLNLYQAVKVVRVPGFASAEILNRARELCEKIKDDAELFKVLEHLADLHGNRLDASATTAVRDDLLRVAGRIENPSLLARVHYGLGRTFMLEGHFKNAEEHFTRALDPGGGQASEDRSALELKSACYGLSSWNLWLLGYPAMALSRACESVAISTAMGSPLTSAQSLAGSSALHLLMRSPDAALQGAEAALEICNERGLSRVLVLSTFYRCWALIQRGDAQQGIMLLLGGSRPMPGIAAQIHERAAKGDGAWGGSTLTRFFNCVAEGCLGARYIEPGLEVADESLAVVQASGVAMYEAEMCRLKGELLLAQDTPMTRQAEECLRRAIETSRQQSGKSWELRATMSLARLLAKQGRHDEARAMLAGIYGWFTEGFDTADLKDAKALLEELAG